MKRLAPIVVLAAALATVAPLPGAGPASRNDVARAELRKILASPEFRDAARESRASSAPEFTVPSWLERWGDRMMRFWRAVRDWLFPSRSQREREHRRDSLFSRAALPAVVLLIAAGLAPILIVLLRRRRLRRAELLPVSRAPAAPEWEDARRLDLAGWEREAARLANSGMFREAIRARYLGSLSYLSEKGAIRYEPFRTNWEYVADLSGRFPSASRPFERLTTGFDRAWYGAAEIGASEASGFFEEEASWRRRFSP